MAKRAGHDQTANDELFQAVLEARDELIERVERRDANHAGNVPYKTFDPAIIALCKAVNAFPEIVTTESCQGYIDGHREDVTWRVYFVPEDRQITLEAYRSIEFLTWVINSGEAESAGFDVMLRLNSFPPSPGEPGQSLYYIIEGRNRHPDELAKLIDDMRQKYFTVSRET